VAAEPESQNSDYSSAGQNGFPGAQCNILPSRHRIIFSHPEITESSASPFVLESQIEEPIPAMNNRPTTLHLPGHLPYPITITSFLLKPDSPIKKHDGLLVYKFWSYVSEEQEDQEEKSVRKEMVEQFDSPWEGVLTEWLVKEGAVISSARLDSLD
jgi:hypothetical protein